MEDRWLAMAKKLQAIASTGMFFGGSEFDKERYADVGLSAAENTVKEVKEESGLDVSIRQLIGVVHKAKHEHTQDVRDFYKFYFLCDDDGTSDPATGPETSEAGFLNLDSLPPLSLGHSIHKHIELAFEFNNDPQMTTVFD